MHNLSFSKGGSRIMPAKFAGRCSYCNAAFPKGASINYSFTLRASFCVKCPEKIGDGTAKAFSMITAPVSNGYYALMGEEATYYFHVYKPDSGNFEGRRITAWFNREMKCWKTVAFCDGMKLAVFLNFRDYLDMCTTLHRLFTSENYPDHSLYYWMCTGFCCVCGEKVVNDGNEHIDHGMCHRCYAVHTVKQVSQPKEWVL